MLQRCRFGCAVLVLLACGWALAAPLPPIAAFFDNPAFAGARLSPDGKFLAARIGRAKGRDMLAVVELGTRASKVVAAFSDVEVGRFEWVNNDRLVFDTEDKSRAQGDTMEAPGLYAVNRDGSNFRQLAERSPSAEASLARTRLLPWNTSLMDQPGAQNSAFVYVTSEHYSERGELDYVDLMRVDTLTGRATTVNRPGAARDWLLDHPGEPRIVTTLERNLLSLHYRDPLTDKWRRLAQFDAFKTGEKEFAPLGFGPDGTLYVSSSEGRDKSALYRFDLASGRRDAEPIVEMKDYDFSGSLVMSNNKLLGVQVLTDARATIWFDARMKAMQERIDKLLPATVNLVSVAARPATPWVLVQSYSDLQPAAWYLFNADTGLLDKVGETHAAIKPSQMGLQEAVRYKARDGLDIPAWLTLPHGSTRKNLPLVVLVHGGPYVRGGEWGWNADAQFLASRGYAVLEPEYRGSTGFGARHFRAGWKQWGLKMQDDIADGAKWAIAEGIVDPQRICIAGASYGGYATLMGLLNDPGLFKCGIDWVGVTDIGLMYTGDWSFRSDISEAYRQYGMPDLVGDLKKDAQQLNATSPLAQAARIKQPLLLAYGGADERVPLYHGRKFYDAVKPHNAQVEMVVYEDEGHGWYLPKNRIDFWTRVEKFLERNIGKP